MNPLELDVRPILSAGGEPFGAIMAAVRELATGQSLRLLAPFRPDPLLQVLARQGFASDTRQLEGGTWEVIFSPVRPAGDAAMPADPAAPVTWPQPLKHIDCTGLNPSAVATHILATLNGLQAGDVLFTLLTGEPLSLVRELQAARHACYGQLDEQGKAFRLMILKAPPIA
jgi:uncharacterized protein (DUF2249 family)